jgi:hypothetical protein
VCSYSGGVPEIEGDDVKLVITGTIEGFGPVRAEQQWTP